MSAGYDGGDDGVFVAAQPAIKRPHGSSQFGAPVKGGVVEDGSAAGAVFVIISL
jgi:hypothetical protein